MTDKHRKLISPFIALIGLLVIEFYNEWRYLGYAIMLGSMFFLMPWDKKPKSK